MGARLGARVLSFWSGIDHAVCDDSRDLMLAGIEATCRLVRAEGLEPSLEPEPGMALQTVADWHAVRAELGADGPALTLDVGHLYAVPEGDPVDLVRTSAPFLAQVHLEDMRHGVHRHLRPGTGDVDFEGVLTALTKGGYVGTVCFELSRSSYCAPVAVAESAEVWRRWHDEARR